MISLEQGFVYAVMIGGIVGLAVGLRKIFVMEERMIKIEKNVEKIVNNVAKEEYEIESAISKLKDKKEGKENGQSSDYEEPQIKMP